MTFSGKHPRTDGKKQFSRSANEYIFVEILGKDGATLPAAAFFEIIANLSRFGRENELPTKVVNF